MITAMVHLIYGAQGAGKTTYSRRLADEINGSRFSIDDWMGELSGPDLPQPMSFPWLMERVKRCERRIWSTASEVVERGGSAILDLSFTKVDDRSRFVAQAKAEGLPVQLHYVTTPLGIRRDRVMARNNDRGETFAFEVKPAMFDFMKQQFESPTEAELSKSIIYESH